MPNRHVHQALAPQVGPPPGLAEKAVCLAVTLRKPSNRVRLETGDVMPGTKLPLHITVEIFKSSKLRDIAKLDNRIRALVRSVSVPFPLAQGYYLVPTKLRWRVSHDLNELFEKRERLQAEFLSGYEDLKSASQELLGSVYKDWMFPLKDELESRFKAGKRYVPVQEYLDHLWIDSAEEIRRFLRREFLQMVESFANNMGRNRSEKTYRQKAEKIVSFLEGFEYRNVLGDEELEALSRQVQEIFQRAGGVRNHARLASEDEAYRQGLVDELGEVARGIKLESGEGGEPVN